jgi:hypothetical protein
MAFLAQRAVEPLATGPCRRHNDKVCAGGLQPPEKRIHVTLARANGAQEDHVGTMVLGDRRHGNGLCVDIQTARERARRWHG